MWVDSSFLADLGRGTDAADAFYDANDDHAFVTSTVVAYELFGGLVAQGADERVAELRRDLDWVEFVPFTIDDALETAILDRELLEACERIPVSDAMVAAATRRRGETLVTADGHFERVEGLDWVNYRG